MGAMRSFELQAVLAPGEAAGKAARGVGGAVADGYGDSLGRGLEFVEAVAIGFLILVALVVVVTVVAVVRALRRRRAPGAAGVTRGGAGAEEA